MKKKNWSYIPSLFRPISTTKFHQMLLMYFRTILEFKALVTMQNHEVEFNKVGEVGCFKLSYKESFASTALASWSEVTGRFSSSMQRMYCQDTKRNPKLPNLSECCLKIQRTKTKASRISFLGTEIFSTMLTSSDWFKVVFLVHNVKEKRKDSHKKTSFHDHSGLWLRVVMEQST